jgi:hypothetical protein
MKKHYFFKTLFFSFITLYTFCQSPGDIAFIAFNADGDKDFAIVALADIAENTTIYFTDDETTGSAGISGLAGSEGVITWITGSEIIKAGTVVIFTDIDSNTNPNFGSSIGSITRSGSFNLSSSKDGIIAFIGTDSSSPTTYLAAIQLGNDSTELGPFDGDGITLTNTGLVVGTSIIVFDDSASPDGAVYIGDRADQISFSNYYSLISDDENNWTNVVNGDGESLLPFSSENFRITHNWTGSIDNDWDNSSNWDNSIVPDINSDIIIPSGLTNYPTISSATTVNSVTIESGTSLIANATLTGDVTYKRNLPTTNWYLISSPVNGETIENFIPNHTLATGTGSNLGLAPFNNSGSTPWSYVDAASTGSFVTGQGYSLKLASAGDISFTGSLNTSDVSYAMTTGDRNNFSLIGNPFTAFVNSATFASDNTSLLTEETIWIWDGTQYITKNAADPIELAPGQGFFVEVNTSGNLNFAASNQSHQAADTFMRQTPNPEIELVIESEADKKSTKIFYIDGKSTDFDNGYDGSLFSGTDTNFSVFTELLSNNQGKKLAIQSLPNADHETMVIPIGLIADAGKEISFSVNTENLPNGLDVYLEDRLNNAFINLSETNYDVVIENQTNNSGQFYLHTTSQKLSTEDIKTDASIGIYKSSKSEITISGINEKVNLRVYSVLGNEIINTEINSNGYSKVNLPSLSSGLYIVKVESDSHKLTKKIIL